MPKQASLTSAAPPRGDRLNRKARRQIRHRPMQRDPCFATVAQLAFLLNVAVSPQLLGLWSNVRWQRIPSPPGAYPCRNLRLRVRGTLSDPYHRTQRCESHTARKSGTRIGISVRLQSSIVAEGLSPMWCQSARTESIRHSEPEAGSPFYELSR